MASSRRKCLNDPDCFCYICGEYIFSDQKKSISDFVKRAYNSYFKIKLGDQDKTWAPHIVCKVCVEHLRQWTNGTRKSLKFGIPMIWREQRNHINDCYFCMVSIKGINGRNKSKWRYPDLDSAKRPVSHSQDIPVPSFTCLAELSEEECISSSESNRQDDIDFEGISSAPQLFQQSQLNDLVRDLNLSKKSAELLASRLAEKNLLYPETKVSYYRTRETEFVHFFSEENSFVFCNNVEGLMMKMGLTKYVPNHWRLFIDSSKRSLKCVLLHNGNNHASIPIGHSTKLTEEQNTVSLVLQKILYHDHQWQICVDLKMVNFLLGQQGGYTKYPCFICLWDSRANNEHWVRKQWPLRENRVIGEKNVITEPLVDKDRIILPPLHIKLGLMKQFVKAINKEGSCFHYICKTFPGLSMEKLKGGIFDGPQIRKLINDRNFQHSMNHLEANAWSSFVIVIKNFLGNHKAQNYTELVKNMLSSFHRLGCRMSIKVHYLDSHLDRFPENLGDLSEEQGERFHQDLRTMEERYQGRWDTHMMADYCWSIKRDCPDHVYRKKSSMHRF